MREAGNVMREEVLGSLFLVLGSGGEPLAKALRAQRIGGE